MEVLLLLRNRKGLLELNEYKFGEEEAEMLDDGPCDATRVRWRGWTDELLLNAEVILSWHTTGF